MPLMGEDLERWCADRNFTFELSVSLWLASRSSMNDFLRLLVGLFRTTPIALYSMTGSSSDSTSKSSKSSQDCSLFIGIASGAGFSRRMESYCSIRDMDRNNSVVYLIKPFTSLRRSLASIDRRSLFLALLVGSAFHCRKTSEDWIQKLNCSGNSYFQLNHLIYDCCIRFLACLVDDLLNVLNTGMGCEQLLIGHLPGIGTRRFGDWSARNVAR